MKPIHFFIAFTLLFACHTPKPNDNKPSISFVEVEPGIKLEIIDWGGKGEPILFLAGLGNSAHVFDAFAPAFNDQYHVWGLTRRGFGASDKPDHGYDLATLSKDILTVLDSLHMERVTLIGHSIAGEELTKFASLYPDRVNKLVYLDAAFDRTDLSHGDHAPPPPEIVMTAKDSSSVAHLQSFFSRAFNIPLCESEIRATCVFDSNGRYMGDRTPDTVYAAMMTIFERPAYEKIKAPALALYCVNDSVQGLFNYYHQLDTEQQEAATEVFRLEQVFLKQQMALFTSNVKNGKVLEFHGANHHLFVSDSAEVSKEIRKFLDR